MTQRKIQDPLTLPKHPQLLHEINQMSIRIKAWHLIDWKDPAYTAEQKDKLLSHNPYPDWEEVEELLMKCYRALNNEREELRKF